MGHVTYFWNFGTPSISREWLELETSNLACRCVTGGTNERNAKLGQRGSKMGHVTYIWNFGTSSIIILGTVRARNVKFCVTGGTNERNAKLGQRGPEMGHVTYFWNFGTPTISWEWLELEMSNLACRCVTGGTNEGNAKLGQKGQKRVTWLTFKILGPLHISGTVRARNIKFCMQIHHQGY